MYTHTHTDTDYEGHTHIIYQRTHTHTQTTKDIYQRTHTHTQGTPQYVVIELPVAATVSSVHIRFQGGFASKECVLMTQYNTDSDWTELQDIYPEDSNSLQVSSIQLLCPL